MIFLFPWWDMLVPWRVFPQSISSKIGSTNLPKFTSRKDEVNLGLKRVNPVSWKASETFSWGLSAYYYQVKSFRKNLGIFLFHISTQQKQAHSSSPTTCLQEEDAKGTEALLTAEYILRIHFKVMHSNPHRTSNQHSTQAPVLVFPAISGWWDVNKNSNTWYWLAWCCCSVLRLSNATRIGCDSLLNTIWNYGNKKL